MSHKEGGPVRTFALELAAQTAAALETCVGGEDTREQAEAKDRLPGLVEACARAEAFDENYARQVEAVRRAMVRTFDEPYAMEHAGDVHTQALAQTAEEQRRRVKRDPRNQTLLLVTLEGLRAAYAAEFGEADEEPTADAPSTVSG